MGAVLLQQVCHEGDVDDGKPQCVDPRQPLLVGERGHLPPKLIEGLVQAEHPPPLAHIGRLPLDYCDNPSASVFGGEPKAPWHYSSLLWEPAAPAALRAWWDVSFAVDMFHLSSELGLTAWRKLQQRDVRGKLWQRDGITSAPLHLHIQSKNKANKALCVLVSRPGEVAVPSLSVQNPGLVSWVFSQV